jgi:hypothetical protein
MASTNCHLYARDEENIPFLRIMKEIPIKGRVIMIGDGQHVKLLIGSLRNEFFRRIFYVVQRILSRVKMEIRLQGSHDFNFLVRWFSQFSSTFLK